MTDENLVKAHTHDGATRPAVEAKADKGFAAKFKSEITEYHNYAVHAEGGGGVDARSNGPLPALNGWCHDQSGVIGKSETKSGVKGESTQGHGGEFAAKNKGSGVRGSSALGYGGQFEATDIKGSPIRLMPQTVGAFNEAPKLSAVGRPGELKVVQNDQGDCTLWICVKGAGGTFPLIRAAAWAKVQLGPAYIGTL
ncbi:hypothetical protein [Streptomyces sp. NBC_00091]|uniref:hypothetical protein n=1 Tax=Streptomyces sp. NBC_00091 TaxID=2975648 RepID=UPI002256331A|nr:hypothetical protein [Streptomyces sp. NBC_00091]MCX5378544.1 hypothetical protein [Streptomyces sp. NBC_00091]